MFFFNCEFFFFFIENIEEKIMFYYVKVLVEVVVEYIVNDLYLEIFIFNIYFVCYWFVKEEFNRLIR